MGLMPSRPNLNVQRSVCITSGCPTHATDRMITQVACSTSGPCHKARVGVLEAQRCGGQGRKRRIHRSAHASGEHLASRRMQGFASGVNSNLSMPRVTNSLVCKRISILPLSSLPLSHFSPSLPISLALEISLSLSLSLDVSLFLTRFSISVFLSHSPFLSLSLSPCLSCSL